MLDPFGLTSFPAPNIPRGLFGGGIRPRPMSLANSKAGASLPPEYTGTATPSPVVSDSNAPPPISEAPPPPSNWQQVVGPDLMADMPQNAPTLGSMSAPSKNLPAPRGMFGGALSAGKTINHGPTLGEAALPTTPGKKRFDWRMAAGILADALSSLNGQPPLFAQNMWRERQAQADHRRRLDQLTQEWQFRNSQPDYATVGNRRFSYNPATGEAQTLYVAPTEAEDYAAALGAEPGTPEYETLLSDYVLRHSGPTATANAMLEEDNRQGNRVSLEGLRHQNRIGMEGVRQNNRISLRGMPTYRDTHPRPSTGRGGGSKAAPGGVREGQTATNPSTGQKVVFRGGKWVPVK